MDILTDLMQWFGHLLTALVVLFWFGVACISVMLICLGQLALGGPKHLERARKSQLGLRGF